MIHPDLLNVIHTIDSLWTAVFVLSTTCMMVLVRYQTTCKVESPLHTLRKPRLRCSAMSYHETNSASRAICKLLELFLMITIVVLCCTILGQSSFRWHDPPRVSTRLEVQGLIIARQKAQHLKLIIAYHSWSASNGSRIAKRRGRIS